MASDLPAHRRGGSFPGAERCLRIDESEAIPREMSSRSAEGQCQPRAATSVGSYAATWQQQLANGGMWSAAAPNLVLKDCPHFHRRQISVFSAGSKSPPISLDHKHHL